VLADELQPVTDENSAMIGLERPVIDFQLNGAQLRPVDERYELELGGILLSQLLQEIGLDHARRHHVFQQIDVLSGDIRPMQIINFHRAGDLGVGHFAHNVNESVTDVAGNRAHQIGEKERRPFEDAEEEDVGFTGVFANAFAQPGDVAGDLFLAEFLLDPFLQSQPRIDRHRR
jgi:hypothetical protein